jgi:acetyl esterase/lipase
VKTNVTVPTLTVFRPAPGKANGTAMVVLPGGAFAVLAWDVEGTEIARWLAEHGVTAFLLKYRIRPFDAPGGPPIKDDADLARALDTKRRIAVADATQAMDVVRQRAGLYGVDAARVGMIGFSAGAITTMGVVLEARAASRPDFAASLYGSMMIDVATPADIPPLFIAAAQNDILMSGESAKTFDRWSKVFRPAELHIYAEGGHGFGMRERNLPVDDWPKTFKAWRKAQGLLPRAGGPRPARG